MLLPEDNKKEDVKVILNNEIKDIEKRVTYLGDKEDEVIYGIVNNILEKNSLVKNIVDVSIEKRGDLNKS